MAMWQCHHDQGVGLEGGRMDLCFGGWYMGVTFLRNFLFLSVCLPDLSILTSYWWNWCTSMTMPVLSHLFEWGQFGSGSALGHLLVVGVRSSYVHSISHGGACGGVVMPLLVGAGTPSMLCVGCVFQARWG